jgi:hypothetical protein
MIVGIGETFDSHKSYLKTFLLFEKKTADGVYAAPRLYSTDRGSCVPGGSPYEDYLLSGVSRGLFS